jgi:hypothetical protein
MSFLVLMAAVSAWCARRYWLRLGDDQWEKRFGTWLVQGFIFPVLVWSVANIGFGDLFPPLVPEIVDAQQAKQPWFWLWGVWTLIGAILVGIHWTAMTYIWLLGRIVRQAEERKDLAATIGFVGLIFATVAGVLLYYSNWIHAGAAVCLALLPVVHFTVDLAEERPVIPTYGRAVAKLKFGKYNDAEWEVISQLEKSENDFEGWMMLAELYARQYRKLDDAVRVVWDVCQQPATQPYQVSVACHKLADWQLEVAENPMGARAALEFLCDRLPGTHFAWMAQQRMRQIPQSVHEFDEAKKPKRIRMPVLKEEFSDVAELQPANAGSRSEVLAEVNGLTEKLTENPDDIPAREKLATALAEKLGEIELATEQLNLLIELEDPSDEQKAKWSAQIATWEFNRDQNQEKFISSLRRIIHDYPQTATAFSAQRRLNLLDHPLARRA